MALAEFAFYCVRNAGANNWYLDEVTLCVLDALADSLGDFNRLTGAYANVTIAIAYNYQGLRSACLRPPLTVFATRLMDTSLSCSSIVDASIRFCTSVPP